LACAALKYQQKEFDHDLRYDLQDQIDLVRPLLGPGFRRRMRCGSGSRVRQRKHDRGDRPSGLNHGFRQRRHVFVSGKSQRLVA
jgi:hypothetical protein